MKKNLLMIPVLLTVLALVFTGCGSDLEDRVDHLSEQVTLLQERVDTLEAEIAQLKNQPESSVSAESGASEGESQPEAALTLYDWLYGDGTLTIDGAFARVMKLGSDIAVQECNLVLTRNESEAESIPLSLLPGEASDSLELELDPFSYDLAALEDGDVLELRLEVLLSDGRQLTAWGGNWEFWDGQLMMIAG